VEKKHLRVGNDPKIPGGIRIDVVWNNESCAVAETVRSAMQRVFASSP